MRDWASTGRRQPPHHTLTPHTHPPHTHPHPPTHSTNNTSSMSATGAEIVRQAKWWLRLRDAPELAVLGGLVGGVVVLASYIIKKTLLNNEAGSYPSVAIRGDAFKQVETGRLGLEDAATGKHSWLWHVAQYKMDQDGANIGVTPFDNRVRPQQFSKPGGGMGGGMHTSVL